MNAQDSTARKLNPPLPRFPCQIGYTNLFLAFGGPPATPLSIHSRSRSVSLLPGTDWISPTNFTSRYRGTTSPRAFGPKELSSRVHGELLHPLTPSSCSLALRNALLMNSGEFFTGDNGAPPWGSWAPPACLLPPPQIGSAPLVSNPTAEVSRYPFAAPLC